MRRRTIDPVKFRELRTDRVGYLRHLAAATGLSHSHLAKVELGERQLSLEAALLVAAALGCHVDDFLSPADGEKVPA